MMTPRWAVYDKQSLHTIKQISRLPRELVDGIRIAAQVFPFKVNSHVLDTLIDWDTAPDDPLFRLWFPHPEMLDPADFHALKALDLAGAEQGAKDALVQRIRTSMNAHPSDQIANLPEADDGLVQGIQHKYHQTVLAFPRQGQTCHSYCSFCFRWPQFTNDSAHRFELGEPARLHAYLRQRHEVSDILLTGGDPMVLSTRRLGEYLAPLIAPEYAHVHTIRLGTKSLTQWPYRFLGADGDQLLRLLGTLIAAGKHVAMMIHVNHWRELCPAPVATAVARLREVGVVIRTQSPVLRHINDASDVWSRNWSMQVQMGMVPYYMFVLRDTGAPHYFGMPLAKALDVYQHATQSLSGLAKTARGPVMSTGPGKIHVTGILEHDGEKHFVLSFLQARNPDWIGKVFLAKHSLSATWIDELSPSDGSETFFFEHEYSRFLHDRSQAPGVAPLEDPPFRAGETVG